MFLDELKKRGDYKGTNGKVLVIGGSEDYVGAPALAALAALRTGIDLVTIIAPQKTGWAISSYTPDLIVKKIQGEHFTHDDSEEVMNLTENYDAVLIGNGIGVEASTQDFVKQIVKSCPVPLVIDADAIKALKETEIDNAILTPHSKEFEILTGEKLPEKKEDKVHLLQFYARQRMVILLKGKEDIIVGKDQVKYNNTGNNGMTIGGTGDVLAGLTVGLLAQTKDLLNSAYYAAFLNGKIGDYLLKKKGVGFTASDFIPLIPEMKRKYL